jgi:hypothetical protein
MGVSFYYCLCGKNKQKEQIDYNRIISIKASNNDFNTQYNNSNLNFFKRNFKKCLAIQDQDLNMSFHEENEENSPFSKLKKKERDDLIKIFDSKISGFVDNINQKINEIFNKDFDLCFKNI